MIPPSFTLLAAMLLFAASTSRARPEEPANSDAGPATSGAVQVASAKPIPESARDFWSFRPPHRAERPRVHDESWASQPLDRFVLARLEGAGLGPARAADAATLIRRVTYDLTGLPPTPDEIARFLADPGPDAYPRLVERLLASPRFGERMASLWLPLARYGEDQAHQVGNDTTLFYPNAYRYREWVINAFNRDLPYDEFLRLQLAADKYEGHTDDLAALGFLGVGPKYYNRNRVDVLADEWEDRVDTVTRSMLGLTVACARCHDHKFDPIPTRDYYALAGVFASTRMVNKAPDGKVVDGKVTADKMPPGTLHMVEDGEVQDLNIFIRGRVDRKGDVAERGFLSVLSDVPTESFKGDSGRRQLAEAIVSKRNPLTARVIVNRLWGAFYGRPLSPTPSNFGHSGLPPTHPELLDDLAVRFMDGGWSIRALVREFVLSSTYRQDSRARTGSSASNDSENTLLSHMNRRRLSIEQWRDGVLSITGELTDSDGRSSDPDDPSGHYRTVYSRVSRLKLNDLLMQFDYPDSNVHSERRSVTTTATQKLFLLNSDFILERARAFAARVGPADGSADATSVRRAFQLVYGRDPDLEELDTVAVFLGGPPEPGMSRWEQFAQVLLTSNEMFYVD